MLFTPTFLYPCIWITHIRRRFNGRMEKKHTQTEWAQSDRRGDRRAGSTYFRILCSQNAHTDPYTRRHIERKIEIGRDSSSAFSLSVYRERKKKRQFVVRISYTHCSGTLRMPCSSLLSVLPLLLLLLVLLSVAVAVCSIRPIVYPSIHLGIWIFSNPDAMKRVVTK